MRLPCNGYAWHFDQAKKSTNPVLEMNDELAFIEFAEIDLRAIASRPGEVAGGHELGSVPIIRWRKG